MDCAGCPRHSDKQFAEDCLINAAKQGIELINRQQAEIERLRKLHQLAVDEREVNVNGFTETLDKIHNKAIKEFAERLKSRTRQMTEYDEGGWDCTRYAIDDEGIDNLVKEMTE
jgi:flagellar motor switch protein FliM